MLKLVASFWLLALVLAPAANGFLAAEIDFNHPVRSADDDLIKDLPGLASDQATFKHYSGYLQADTSNNRFWHYWFVESQSDPKNDPLVLWLNGGPGCSSMLGLLTELGPFRVANNDTITMNPYSWNKRANVLFMESPAGVGFSYAANGDTTADDDTTAKFNYLALKSFLRKFPAYSRSPLYLTGESYAGVYLPTLAVLVNKDMELNFKGVAIGNGYLDANKLAESLVYFSYYHGLIGASTWSGLSEYCCDGKAPARGQCHFMNPDRSAKCAVYVGEATDAILSSGVNPYNLYDKCYGADQLARSLVPTSISRELVDKSLILSAFNQTRKFKNDSGPRSYKYLHLRAGTKFTLNERVRSDPPCTDESVVVNYLNRQDVRTALNVPMKVQPFTTCSNISYTMIYPSRPGGLAPQMRELINSSRKPTLLVYNGDTDLMCNFFGDEWFVDDLDRKVEHDYTAWYTNDQVSGFVKYFDRIAFVTVKGSGHMVPSDRPAEALHMFEMFLDGMKPVEKR